MCVHQCKQSHADMGSVLLQNLETLLQVYLPMSYMYGKRGTCKETPLTAAIRGELYTQSYDSIDWNAARNQCAKEDLYYPHPKVASHNDFKQ